MDKRMQSIVRELVPTSIQGLLPLPSLAFYATRYGQCPLWFEEGAT
jgi:hypothetical protein